MRKGLTLIEVLTASLILVIVAIGSASIVMSNKEQQFETEKVFLAESIIKERLEYLRTMTRRQDIYDEILPYATGGGTVDLDGGGTNSSWSGSRQTITIERISGDDTTLYLEYNVDQEKIQLVGLNYTSVLKVTAIVSHKVSSGGEGQDQFEEILRISALMRN